MLLLLRRQVWDINILRIRAHSENDDSREEVPGTTTGLSEERARIKRQEARKMGKVLHVAPVLRPLTLCPLPI